MMSILANDSEYTVKTALMPQSMGHATTKIRFEGDENLTISRLVSAAVPALLEDMRTIQVAPGHRADSMSDIPWHQFRCRGNHVGYSPIMVGVGL